MIPEDLQYTPEHTWIRTTGPGTVRVGITDHAQDRLGDVIFVQLPEPGDHVVAGIAFGDVESTKSTSDLVAPVSGKVVATNPELTDKPELVNSAPYEGGWMLDIQLNATSEQEVTSLLNASQYRSFVE